MFISSWWVPDEVLNDLDSQKGRLTHSSPSDGALKASVFAEKKLSATGEDRGVISDVSFYPLVSMHTF